jgi:hypothetical protein
VPREVQRCCSVGAAPLLLQLWCRARSVSVKGGAEVLQCGSGTPCSCSCDAAYPTALTTSDESSAAGISSSPSDAIVRVCAWRAGSGAFCANPIQVRCSACEMKSTLPYDTMNRLCSSRSLTLLTREFLPRRKLPSSQAHPPTPALGVRGQVTALQERCASASMPTAVKHATLARAQSRRARACV